ncbi:12375_t:CDS:2 [Funneliformis caledonium]|uniref:12375_t:CDS:1 n=1 Tax=Funneliformis caledonium TaxID=1117310 RepID=A0A9N9B685_9GLOM|nr:12375_t:CDS:2 [Funneliformis caledonium]
MSHYSHLVLSEEIIFLREIHMDTEQPANKVSQRLQNELKQLYVEKVLPACKTDSKVEIEYATSIIASPQREPLTLENQKGNPSSEMNKNARSQPVRDNYSRESMLSPKIHSVTHILIATPNKPIITKATYVEYSAHIISAFNSTIHLVKGTIEEQAYEKVKNILQMGNKLVINDLIVKKLENIFQASYSEIESKIISETKIEDNQMTEEDRKRYKITQRSKQNVFEKFGERKTDLFILRLSDASELLNVEVSRPPYRSTKKHIIGDVKKLLVMAICSLCRLFSNNLDYDIGDAKMLKLIASRS